MTKQFKLYRDGRFFDLAADPDEQRPRQVVDLTGSEAKAADQLQAVLEQYADARPAEMDVAAAAAAREEKANAGQRTGKRRGRAEQESAGQSQKS